MVIHVDLLGAEAPEELRSSVEDEPRKLPEKSDVTKSQLKEAPLPFERSGAFPRTNRSSIDFAVRSTCGGGYVKHHTLTLGLSDMTAETLDTPIIGQRQFS